MVEFRNFLIWIEIKCFKYHLNDFDFLWHTVKYFGNIYIIFFTSFNFGVHENKAVMLPKFLEK